MTKDDKEEISNSWVDTITNYPDFHSVATQMMCACTAATLLHVTADKESAANMKAEINDIRNKIPISSFFVQSNLKDDVLAKALATPTSRLYFFTLNQIYIPALLSRLNMDYESMIRKFADNLLPAVPSAREKSVLPDNLFIELKCDAEIVKELLSRDPLPFTIYMFRTSLPFSEAFTFDN